MVFSSQKNLKCTEHCTEYFSDNSFVLSSQFPEMDQTWYADDAGAGGVDAIKRHFES
jgi:hypothetical protein